MKFIRGAEWKSDVENDDHALAKFKTMNLNELAKTVFSPCRLYRYTLWRKWDCDSLTGCSDDLKHSHEFVQFIGLNPSTADETRDDPTIRRCIAFAKSWGYGAMCMTNLFAFRATDPKQMMKKENLADIDNQHHILSCGSEAAIVVAAWGVNGTFACRDLTVKQWLSQAKIPVFHLGLTKEGHPKHPLYLPKTLTPIPL